MGFVIYGEPRLHYAIFGVNPNDLLKDFASPISLSD